MPGLPEELKSFMEEMRERDNQAWEKRFERTDKEWERRLAERDIIWEKRLEVIQGRNEELSQENINLRRNILGKMEVIERLESRVEQLISTANEQAKLIVDLRTKSEDLSTQLTNLLTTNTKLESELTEFIKKNTELERKVQELLVSNKELADTVERISKGKWSTKSKVFLAITLISLLAGVGLMTAGVVLLPATIGVGLIVGAGVAKCTAVGFATATACYK